MSSLHPDPMAVVAPNTTSAPIISAAHVPDVRPLPQKSKHVQSDSDEDMPLVRKAAPAIKRPVLDSSSEEDSRPLAKKARQSNVSVGKKRRVVESDDESEEGVPKKINGTNGTKTDSKAKPASSSVKSKPPPPSSPLSSGSGDETPLAKSKAKPPPKPRISTSSVKTNGIKKPTKPVSESENEDDDDGASFSDESSEAPLAKPKATAKAKPRASTSSAKTNGRKSTKSRKDVSSESEEDDDDDASFSESEGEKPLAEKKAAAKPRKSNGAVAPKKRVSNVKKEVKEEPDSEDDDVPLARNGKAKVAIKAKGKEKAKEEKVVVKKEKKVKDEDDEDDERYKWWEAQDNDGSVKWTKLEHRGVLFPPPYIPLPKGIKMRYDKTPLTLPPDSEEVAGFFAAMTGTDHAADKKFRENFFNDFKEVLKEYPPKEGIKVTKLELCDFGPMFEHFEREKEKKKAMTRDEKKAIKDAKDELEKPYLFANVDGRKEKVGNFRAEPPGLFRGRGEHPKKGTLKKRLQPSDIILNIAQDAPIPVPNVPGEWGGVQHDNTVTWLAHWKENVNGNSKYVFLSAGSAWKGQSDRNKFEKARELIKHVDKIRKDYNEDLKSKVMADRQRATALYFIDKLALRAGNEKGEDEAETFGCCSLRYEHVTLEPPSNVIFDFLGKDSMRFHQEVDVDPKVFKNIRLFKEGKDVGDDLFDRLTTGGLNKYLAEQMKGLTAKVFRTYNASWTFQIQLKNTPKNGSIQEKIAAYNTANRDVAILCNHQKTVSKGFEASFAKMGDKVRALKYQRMKLRYQLFSLEPKAKKRYPDYAEDESDLDDEFMERHEKELKEKAIEVATKKWEKDNVKLEEEKEDKKPKSVLDDRIKEIKAEFKELAKERKTRKVEPKRGATEEKLVENIKKMDDRIEAAKVQMGDRDKTKDVALGTSKINYIDPRLTVAWAAKYGVPLEKLFSKTLREKFPWAEAEADADWVF